MTRTEFSCYFEEQTKWPLDREPWEPGLVWVPNYGSTRDFAKDKFEEEVREGMMEKMSMEAFVDRYGENRAIAALAVIVEDEDKGKKRLIHDATHGVRVNHRIRCRDKIRAPGAREKEQILLETMERGEIAFSIVGDISKAHRRFTHQHITRATRAEKRQLVLQPIHTMRTAGRQRALLTHNNSVYACNMRFFKILQVKNKDCFFGGHRKQELAGFADFKRLAELYIHKGRRTTVLALEKAGKPRSPSFFCFDLTLQRGKDKSSTFAVESSLQLELTHMRLWLCAMSARASLGQGLPGPQQWIVAAALSLECTFSRFCFRQGCICDKSKQSETCFSPHTRWWAAEPVCQ